MERVRKIARRRNHKRRKKKTEQQCCVVHIQIHNPVLAKQKLQNIQISDIFRLHIFKGKLKNLSVYILSKNKQRKKGKNTGTEVIKSKDNKPNYFHGILPTYKK